MLSIYKYIYILLFILKCLFSSCLFSFPLRTFVEVRISFHGLKKLSNSESTDITRQDTIVTMGMVNPCNNNYKFYQSVGEKKEGGRIAAIVNKQKFVCDDTDLGEFLLLEYLLLSSVQIFQYSLILY